MGGLWKDNGHNLNAHNPPEFQRWQWVARGEVTNLIVPFKKDTYRQVMLAFADLAI